MSEGGKGKLWMWIAIGCLVVALGSTLYGAWAQLHGRRIAPPIPEQPKICTYCGKGEAAMSWGTLGGAERNICAGCMTKNADLCFVLLKQIREQNGKKEAKAVPPSIPQPNKGSGGGEAPPVSHSNAGEIYVPPGTPAEVEYSETAPVTEREF